MKICVDNEIEKYRKLVSVASPNTEKVTDYLNTYLEILKVIGFNDNQIEVGLLYVCYQRGLIEEIPEDERQYNGDEDND